MVLGPRMAPWLLPPLCPPAAAASRWCRLGPRRVQACWGSLRLAALHACGRTKSSFGAS
jgi:hypothetical protein